MKGVKIQKLAEQPSGQPYGKIGKYCFERGDTAVIAINQNIKFIACLSFNKEGAARGNHRHFRRHEGFYVTKGKLIGRFKNLDTGEELQQEFEPGHLISIDPGIAHAFKGIEYSKVIEFADLPFDEKDQEKVELL